MKNTCKSATFRFLLCLLVSLWIGASGCGGGGDTASDGSGSGSSGTSLASGIVMRWEAPETFSDSTSLDPAEDLKGYEIYINETGMFSEDDQPAAYVSAVDANGNPTESFDFGNLDYPFEKGGTYYVSMRSISMSEVKSAFSAVISFTI